MTKKFLVIAHWDEEAGMWVATSDDIPGLVTEAKSIDALMERIVAVSPELLEDNNRLVDSGDISDDLLELCVQSSFKSHTAALR